MRYLDLTRTFIHNMPVYPGDPSPELIKTEDLYKEGYMGYQIKTGMHVGTHIDAPFHMLEDGKRLSEITVNKYFGRGYLIDARGKSIIDIEVLNGLSIERDSIILIMTGFSGKYGQPEYYENYPEISEKLATRLVELGMKIVGLDSPSPDRPPFNIHKLLLKQEILIIENLMNLEGLLNVSSFEIFALPMKLYAEAAPVRVVAKIG